MGWLYFGFSLYIYNCLSIFQKSPNLESAIPPVEALGSIMGTHTRLTTQSPQLTTEIQKNLLHLTFLINVSTKVRLCLWFEYRDFITKHLPSVLILVIADRIMNDSLCCFYKYNWCLCRFKAKLYICLKHV